jgi:hypothetical protein
MMNATLQDVFIDSGASYYTKVWDVYNATTQAIMNRTSATNE